jgi:hypothetical protein
VLIEDIISERRLSVVIVAWIGCMGWCFWCSLSRYFFHLNFSFCLSSLRNWEVWKAEVHGLYILTPCRSFFFGSSFSRFYKLLSCLIEFLPGMTMTTCVETLVYMYNWNTMVLILNLRVVKFHAWTRFVQTIMLPPPALIVI